MYVQKLDEIIKCTKIVFRRYLYDRKMCVQKLDEIIKCTKIVFRRYLYDR